MLLVACGRTAPFTDDKGRVLPGSIATMEDVSLGGLRQRIWLRGRNVHAPPLVLLNGGPGANTSALFRRYDAALEDDFLVVYWDQRGSGRSYVAARDSGQPLTIDRLLGDLDALVDHVRSRFGAPRVVLLGHSFGSVLAVRYAAAHPEKVAVLVSIAQVVATREGDRIAFAFAMEEAARRRDAAALAALDRIGPPPHDVDAALAMDRWLERLGGVFHGDLSTGRLILDALATDEATVVDVVRFGQGNRYSLESLAGELDVLDLRGITRFDMPVFFLEGRHDQRTPSRLAARYWLTLTAPCKRLVWFEGSAHNPPWEQPRAFVCCPARADLAGGRFAGRLRRCCRGAGAGVSA
jgi:pimeloyl-ACP methyl ester carboxylesterase